MQSVCYLLGKVPSLLSLLLPASQSSPHLSALSSHISHRCHMEADSCAQLPSSAHFLPKEDFLDVILLCENAKQFIILVKCFFKGINFQALCWFSFDFAKMTKQQLLLKY